MLYEITDNSGYLIGTHHRYSGFIPLDACSWLDKLNLDIGDKAGIEGLNYKRVA